ncbi:hypothetical protein CWS01_00515 [Niallia nealsonii]|uniref:Uncharacterized protein n=1 Tax=Niallia nealsonii TaxID=115979 RepID=A0A2N0Z819_9BACI|nr:hypothetical protein CWS01_00515 [Niallia nealsonii]
MGLAGQVRPRRRYAEEAHRPPHGKRASWNGKQPTPLKVTKFTKTAFKIKGLACEACPFCFCLFLIHE